MNTLPTLEDDWPFLLSLLPSNLEESAQQTKALVRKREIQSAQTLLRLAFAYGYANLSLRETVAWAAQRGLAHLSDVALLKRLRKAGDWIGQILTHKLAQRHSTLLGPLKPGLRVRLVDATSVCRPGSKGTDWRVHLGMDLATLCIDDAQLTQASGGESFTRFSLKPDEIVVGDRGYAHRKGIWSVIAQQAQVLVRLNLQHVPLQTREGTELDLMGVLRGLKAGEVLDLPLQIAPDPKAGIPAILGRLVAVRKSAKAAEKARRKVIAEARKKGRTPSAETLESCDYLFVFTTLSPSQLSGKEVLQLYGFRWQIEMSFKRMKSLLELDVLAAQDPQLCRSVLLTKLLATLLVEDLTQRWGAFSPWGYGCLTSFESVSVVQGGGKNPAPGDRLGLELEAMAA